MLFGSIFGSLQAGNIIKKFGERVTAIICDVLVILFR